VKQVQGLFQGRANFGKRNYRAHIFDASVLFLTCAFILLFLWYSEINATTIVIRYDDYTIERPDTFDLKILEFFRKEGIPISIGVIPFVLPPKGVDQSLSVTELAVNKLRGLRHAVGDGFADVALHGYLHSPVKLTHYHSPTEFAGVNLESQIQMLVRGKAYVEKIIGARVLWFIPPWNTYDRNTIEALKVAGFQGISAGTYGEAPNGSEFKFLPATCSWNNLKAAVLTAKKLDKSEEPIIVVMLHSYDIDESSKQSQGNSIRLQEFSKLIAWTKSQPEVKFLSLKALLEKPGLDLSVERYIEHQAYLSAIDILPHVFHPIHRNLYLNRELTQRMTIKAWTAMAIFYIGLILASGLVAFFLGPIIFQRRDHHLKASVVAGLICVLAAGWIVYALASSASFRGALNMKVSMGACLIIGAWAGLITSYISKTNREDLAQLSENS